jgi:hypothetical protein
MIDYIKEYGVATIDYEYILHNVKSDILELIKLSETSVREVLSFYNSIGLYEEISTIIIHRPDLILTQLNVLEEAIKKVRVNAFVGMVRNDIDNLIILGI